ncbi:MAG: DUF3592 domain-containing protein [Oscillospiraceae bacterium]|nr:DUF3592 domain-containing protein [Oscillospiraceae bacterium]
MTEKKIMILIGIIVLPVAVGLTALMYWLCFYRPAYRAEHYTAETTGTVEKISGFTSCDIRVPMVRYSVGEMEYTAYGPNFSGSKYISAEVGSIQLAGYSCNITPDGELPLIVEIRGSKAAAQEAMNARYPEGKTVPVFYDPDSPKDAFVERDAPIPRTVGIMLVTIPSVMTAACIILILIGILKPKA